MGQVAAQDEGKVLREGDPQPTRHKDRENPEVCEEAVRAQKKNF